MTRTARFRLGQIVRHRIYPFRGIVFDIDPVFGELRDGIYAAGERKAQ